MPHKYFFSFIKQGCMGSFLPQLPFSPFCLAPVISVCNIKGEDKGWFQPSKTTLIVENKKDFNSQNPNPLLNMPLNITFACADQNSIHVLHAYFKRMSCCTYIYLYANLLLHSLCKSKQHVLRIQNVIHVIFCSIKTRLIT